MARSLPPRVRGWCLFRRGAIDVDRGRLDDAVAPIAEAAELFRAERWTLARVLAYGVTALRDVGGRQDSSVALGHAGALGSVAGPRLYVSGDNLLLLTGYSGYDPEVYTDAGLATRGLDYLSYPRPRTFTAGVHVAF